MNEERRTVLKTVGAGLALAAGTGTAAARGPPTGRGPKQGASADASIVETAEAAGFSTLLTAVENADPAVAQTLTNDDQYTVFAPTNAAFADFFATVESATGLTAGDLLEDPNALLTNTLLFHVAEGRRYATSITNPAPVDTLLDEPISVDGTTLDGRANIVATDIEASNGVVHAIDTVLTPAAVDDLL